MASQFADQVLCLEKVEKRGTGKDEREKDWRPCDRLEAAAKTVVH